MRSKKQKQSNKKKQKNRHQQESHFSDDDDDISITIKPSSLSTNPLLTRQTRFLQSLNSKERNDFFDTSIIDSDRRAEIWMEQADVGEECVDRYAWATPDNRALCILAEFAPLVEIGCGSNAYWCQQMTKHGIDVVGYDVNPKSGGKIGERTTKNNMTFPVRQGGPTLLSTDPNLKERTLFLCYPDEEAQPDNPNDSDGVPVSMGAMCLEHYKGDTVVHVGELYGDCISLDQSPWGRSSAPDFQQRLSSEYHCILRVGLTNWLHTKDTLSVWKRTRTKCSLVFASDDQKGERDGDDEVSVEEEEALYKHIPVEERLPTEVAAPCVKHLLLQMPRSKTGEETTTHVPVESKKRQITKNPAPSEPKRKSRKNRKAKRKSRSESMDSSAVGTEYVTPW